MSTMAVAWGVFTLNGMNGSSGTWLLMVRISKCLGVCNEVTPPTPMSVAAVAMWDRTFAGWNQCGRVTSTLMCQTNCSKRGLMMLSQAP